MLKTQYKKVLETENKDEAEKLYKDAVAVIDKGASKGIIHSNNASRKKAALTRHMNKLAQPKAEKK